MNIDPNSSPSSPKLLPSSSFEQSIDFGVQFAAILQLGDVIELVGDLGGGKTTFVKGIAQGLGVTQTVTSPTYNIQRSYSLTAGGTLEHYDLYRLGDDEILLEEMEEVVAAKDAIICVEWADHFTRHLSDDRFIVKLHYVDDTNRSIEIQATGPSTQERLTTLNLGKSS